MAASRASIVEHVRAMLEFQRRRRRSVRQRQPDPHPGQGGGRRRRLRHPDLHRGVSAAAVRSRDRAVPLDGAVGRSRPTSADRRSRAGDVPGRQARRQLDSSRPRAMCRSRACRRASPGSGMAQATDLALAVNALVAKGELAGADRVLARSPRRGGHGPSQHHDRAHAGRLGRHRRLAAARRDGDVFLDGRSRGHPLGRRRLRRLYDERRRDVDRRRTAKLRPRAWRGRSPTTRRSASCAMPTPATRRRSTRRRARASGASRSNAESGATERTLARGDVPCDKRRRVLPTL